MKTRCSTNWLVAMVCGLLLTAPGLAWTGGPPRGPDWGSGDTRWPIKKCKKWKVKLAASKQELVACEEDLAVCDEEPCAVFPGDGWPEDADPSGGVPLIYTDNGDGTFTDDNTGLMWEIKDGDDGVPDYDNPHDVDNGYSWPATRFLAELNDAQNPFAGYTDWRLPTVKELQSLVDYSVFDPAASFPGEVGTATDFNRPVYWSSTSEHPDDSNPAWYVSFEYGRVSSSEKDNTYSVRAVRGGR